jgi:hypothetical protein
MSRDRDGVLEAIERWERSGLIDDATAGRLRAEVAATGAEGTRRLSQYALAATGGIVLLLAGGLFIEWSWPFMNDAVRTGVLAAIAVTVLLLGVRLEWSGRWRPASYLMQSAALMLLLWAFMFSEQVWDDLTVGGVVAGVLALAAPIVLAPRAMQRGVVMPAVHLAMAFGFLAVFLDRATGLSADAIVWVLDGVLLVAVLALGSLVRRDPYGERHPWAFNAFITAMFGGFLLIALTAVGPLDWNDQTVLPLDLWLVLTVALTVRGIAHDDGRRREWLASLLACLLLVWIPLGFHTALEALDGPPELPLLLVGGAAVAGFVYATRHGFRHLTWASAVAFTAPLWYWGVDRGGAIGAVLALAATAGLLFWMAGRTGRAEG